MDWYGVVLAGGKSTRMGTDKAWISWGGKTFLDLAQERLMKIVGEDRVLVSGEGRGDRSVPDLRPGLGPLGGLHAVCESLPGDAALLVVPVDMPLLGVADLQRLRDALVFSPCAAVYFEGSPLPMAIRLEQKVRHELAARTARACEDRSIGELLRELGAISLSRDSHDPRLLNFNDPRELELARRVHETHP